MGAEAVSTGPESREGGSWGLEAKDSQVLSLTLGAGWLQAGCLERTEAHSQGGNEMAGAGGWDPSRPEAWASATPGR